MWEFIKSGIDGNCILFGVNIFDYDWINTGQKIEISDPIYNRKHVFTVYNAELEFRTVTFAAGEFSNCVYGFYAQDVDSDLK